MLGVVFLPLSQVNCCHAETSAHSATGWVKMVVELDVRAAAYNMAALTATVALYRGLVRKGVLTREEVRQTLLDAAIARSVEAEGLRREPGMNMLGINQ